MRSGKGSVRRNILNSHLGSCKVPHSDRPIGWAGPWLKDDGWSLSSSASFAAGFLRSETPPSRGSAPGDRRPQLSHP